MPYLLWDASALTKRYIPEPGSATVDKLFELIPPNQMACTVIGAAEVYSALVRAHNAGSISSVSFAIAKSAMRSELIYDPAFNLLTVDDAAIFTGFAFMDRYHINATDSTILAAFLRASVAIPITTRPPIVVASDRRLLSAAQSEGFQKLDPEALSDTDVPAFLAGL